ncbi:MAG: putative DNA binding domain-containing protein [Candidatus Cloacimonadota bacterium]|nr:putative DNA binding domain-containing protein [Candidatus Cloacimonadota bacterium]
MALPINVENLIKGNIIESERIELKAGWNPEKILHTICAFANDFNNIGGGYIIIGVAEENGVAELPPSGIQINQIDKILKELLKICNYISPNYFPTVSPEVINGKHIIIIWAPPGDTRPYKAPKRISDKTSKLYYIRRMSSTVQAKDQEVLKLIELTAKVTFDNRINQQATLDDMNLTNITTFLKEVKSTLYEQITKISFEELCINMNIARGPKEDIHPLNAGLLLFSDEPHKFFRGAKIELIVYEDSIGDKFYEKIFTGPIHIQLRNVLDYIKNYFIEEKVRKIEGIAEANRFYNYPYEAIEEAVSNAVYHKSYERKNPIEINLRPDCIEILSFPGPIPPVDNEMLKKDRVVARDYRNSRIGDFLKELHLTEGRGTGIPKIRNFLKNNGSPDPVFETDNDRTYFLTTLKSHPDSEMELSRDQVSDQFGTKLALSWHQVMSHANPHENNELIGYLVLSLSQACPKLEKPKIHAIILLYCIDPRKITEIMAIVKQTNRSRFKKNYIDKLIELNYLEYTNPNKLIDPNQKYHLTERGKLLFGKFKK